MKCANCKVGNLKNVFCVACAKKLHDEIERLETQVKMQQAFSRSCNNDRERLKKELEGMRAKDG